MDELIEARSERASAIATAGGIEAALDSGALLRRIDTTLSEALVLGLLRQGVRTFIVVLGHGSTEVGEVLRVYEAQGLLCTCPVRSEIEASHAATALRWVTGEKAAVVTSIGPGALQALAGALAPASDGVGVYYLVGDETTEAEGPNMQGVPKPAQGLYLQLFATLGHAYCLHTATALGTALRRGRAVVDHPHRPGPFFLLLPLNTQPAALPTWNLDELPDARPLPALGAAAGQESYEAAAEALLEARRVVVKVGGGGLHAGGALLDLLDLVDGVAVLSPLTTGAMPYDHQRNMLVGGSKGSICGNHAMEEADLLVAVGTRFVCQSDCSRTGFPKVGRVININTDIDDVSHYGKTIALLGEAGATLAKLSEAIRARGGKEQKKRSPWLESCSEARRRWEGFKAERYDTETLHDDLWGEPVLTQPAAIKAATDWARAHGVVAFFDAGDVQANGFQVVEDERPGQTFTESGASYMGFAASALLATGLAEEPFYALALSGDGSFTMTPQVLIDGVSNGATGCVLLLDNRRMGAISALQVDQYGQDHASWDHLRVDYLAWARAVSGVQALDAGRSAGSLTRALDSALAYEGISLVHCPVYFGPDPLGGLGAWGRWNVGNWVSGVQQLRHDIGL